MQREILVFALVVIVTIQKSDKQKQSSCLQERCLDELESLEYDILEYHKCLHRNRICFMHLFKSAKYYCMISCFSRRSPNYIQCQHQCLQSMLNQQNSLLNKGMSSTLSKNHQRYRSMQAKNANWKDMNTQQDESTNNDNKEINQQDNNEESQGINIWDVLIAGGVMLVIISVFCLLAKRASYLKRARQVNQIDNLQQKQPQQILQTCDQMITSQITIFQGIPCIQKNNTLLSPSFKNLHQDVHANFNGSEAQTKPGTIGDIFSTPETVRDVAATVVEKQQNNPNENEIPCINEVRINQIQPLKDEQKNNFTQNTQQLFQRARHNRNQRKSSLLPINLTGNSKTSLNQSINRQTEKQEFRKNIPTTCTSNSTFQSIDLQKENNTLIRKITINSCEGPQSPSQLSSRQRFKLHSNSKVDFLQQQPENNQN